MIHSFDLESVQVCFLSFDSETSIHIIEFKVYTIILEVDSCDMLLVQLGGRSSDGSFTIVAPFAGSPAEEVSDALHSSN